MASTDDVLKMSESELLRRGSISKSILVQTILELRKDRENSQQGGSILELECILSKKLDPIMKKLESITDIIRTLKSRVDHLQEECAELRRVKGFEVEDLCREAAERLHRRKYLIMSGIPEQTNGSAEQRREADSSAIVEVAAAVGVSDFDPTEVSRIGKPRTSGPRLLRFKCSDNEDRMTLLRKSRDLRTHSSFCNTFINPDQTRLQRENSKALRTELKHRRDNGEDVCIKYGKIVARSSNAQNFH